MSVCMCVIVILRLTNFTVLASEALRTLALVCTVTVLTCSSISAGTLRALVHVWTHAKKAFKLIFKIE